MCAFVCMHVCVCVLFVIICVDPACLCGSVLCDHCRHGPVVSESADMWYMVSRVEYCVGIVLADSAHCVSVVLVGCSMFLTRVASSCRMEREM